jgi:hypothetical protein
MSTKGRETWATPPGRFSEGDMPKDALEILFLALVGIVGVALISAWWRVRMTPRQFTAVRASRGTVIPLFVTTASYLFFLVSCAVPRALGPDYSTRRYAVIGVNCGLAAVMFVISALTRTFSRWKVALSALALALIWLIVGAVSSAV